MPDTRGATPAPLIPEDEDPGRPQLPPPFHGTGRPEHSPVPQTLPRPMASGQHPPRAPPQQRANLKTTPSGLVGGLRGAGRPCPVGMRLGALAAVTLQSLPGEPAPRSRGPTGGPPRKCANAGSAAGHLSAPRALGIREQNPLTQTSPTYSSKPRKPYAQQRRKPGFPQRSRETTCPEVHRSVRRRSGPGPTS